MLRLVLCSCLLVCWSAPAALAQENLDTWLDGFQAQVKARLAASGPKDAVLEVRINHAGLVRNAFVIEPSGNVDADAAALKVVRQAAPFRSLPGAVAQVAVTLKLKAGALQASVLPRSSFLGLTTRETEAKGEQPGQVALVGWTSLEAERAGLRHLDLLNAIAGRPVVKTSDIGTILQAHRPGETVALKIKRGKREMELPLQLTGRPLRLPVLAPEEPPQKAARLTPLPETNLSKAERFFGWGNVLTVSEPQPGALTLVVGPLADKTVLQERTSALFKQLQKAGMQTLGVEVEALTGEQSWQAVATADAFRVQPAVPTWRGRSPILAAGTYLPIRLEVDKPDGIRQGTTQPVTGKILYDLTDANGIPVLRSGTAVSGNLVTTPPFGHRLVLESIGADKLPVAGESTVLSTREVAIERRFSSNILAHASFLYAGEVVGVRLTKPLRPPIEVPIERLELWQEPAVLPELGSRRDEKQALVLYSQGVQAAAQKQWDVAIEKLQASLGIFPARETRAYLGWVYERRAEALLALDDTPAAIRSLELALHTRSKLSNALALLSSAYAALFDEVGASLSTEALDYYRHRAEVYGLALQEHSPRTGFLFSQDSPSTTAGDYLQAMFYAYTRFGNAAAAATRQVVVRLSRMPVRVYVGPAPEPAFAQIVWNATQKWEAAAEGLVQFARVEQPTEADIVVFFSSINSPLGGYSESGTFDFNPRAFDNKLTAANIDLELFNFLGYRREDQLKVVELVAVHELGHALGLRGHSEDIDDLMYYAVTGLSELSARDRRTIQQLFSTRPDITRP